jgi:hypothetical protein
MADTINLDDKRPGREERPPRATAKPPRDAATSRSGEGDKGGAAAPPSRPRRSRQSADARIKESLTGMYAMIGSGMSGIGAVQQNAGLYAAGVNVATQAEVIADNWIDCANEIPAVRRGLESMLKGGAVTVLVMSHVGLVLPALASAGVVPQQVGNMFLSPEAVEQGMQFQAAQAAAAAENGTPTP